MNKHVGLGLALLLVVGFFLWQKNPPLMDGLLLQPGLNNQVVYMGAEKPVEEAIAPILDYIPHGAAFWVIRDGQWDVYPPHAPGDATFTTLKTGDVCSIEVTQECWWDWGSNYSYYKLPPS